MADTQKTRVYQNAYHLQLLRTLVASKWTLLVIYAIQHDTKRYSEINKTVDGITQKVLTDTLRKLERDGIIERQIYPVIPPKVEYKLTAPGLELLNVTETMAQWAEKHVGEIETSRKTFDKRIKA